MIEVTQCTIDWYVDNNKLLHKNTEVVSDIINESKFFIGELCVVRGNKHNLFGMYIDIKESKIQVGMVDQL